MGYHSCVCYHYKKALQNGRQHEHMPPSTELMEEKILNHQRPATRARSVRAAPIPFPANLVFQSSVHAAAAETVTTVDNTAAAITQSLPVALRGEAVSPLECTAHSNTDTILHAIYTEVERLPRRYKL